MLFSTSVQHPRGLNPGMPEKVTVIVRGGDVKIGTIVQFELDANEGEVTASLNYGGSTDPTSNVIASIANEGKLTQALYHIYGVCVADIDDDATGEVYIRGDVPLYWDAASDATGSGGTPGSDAGLIELVSANTERIICVARETTILYVSGNGATLTQCWFEGFYSLGQFNA